MASASELFGQALFVCQHPIEPILSLADDPSGLSFPRSWIQVARTGKYVSSRYGEFSITGDDLNTMLRNFTTITPQAPTRLPVDYDHLSMNPQKPGDGKAAGWFTGKMELRNGGQQLWGEVEWTPAAAKAIQAHEYQFISPSFVKDYKHKDGRKIGTTLLAAAVTNHPFLEGMAPLSLSGQGEFAVPVSALRKSKGVVTMSQYMLKLKDGSEVEVDEAELKAIPFVQNLMAHPDDRIDGNMVETMANQVTSLSGQVEALSAELKSARDKAADLEVEKKLDSLTRAGKLLPKQRSWAKTYALSDSNGFDQWAAVQEPLVKVDGKPQGVDASDTVDADKAGNDLVSLSQVYAKEHNMSFSKAMNEVSAANPEMAKAYRDMFAPEIVEE